MGLNTLPYWWALKLIQFPPMVKKKPGHSSVVTDTKGELGALGSAVQAFKGPKYHSVVTF